MAPEGQNPLRSALTQQLHCGSAPRSRSAGLTVGPATLFSGLGSELGLHLATA